MNTPQRIILILTALVLVILCLWTPRTDVINRSSERYRQTVQAGRYWIATRSNYPVDYSKLLAECGATMIVGLMLTAAAKSKADG